MSKSYQGTEKTFRFYQDLSHLDQKGAITAEYVWIDGTGITLRAKSRTLTKPINSLEDIPEWNFDGSSTYQASTNNSEVILKPVAYFNDPFREGNNIFVICEAFIWGDKDFKTLIPANTNFRHYAKKIFDAVKDQKPWFGIEQEYSLLEQKSTFSVKPIGWPTNGFPGPQGAYYCSVGANIAFGRSILDAHYKACLYAGVKISGTNLETMPGQLEFQVGPCEGISIGDHLWMGRYLLGRVAEDFGISVSFDPKLFKHFSGAGCHINFSSEHMRDVGGMDYIKEIMKRFENKHTTHMALYGDNSLRLSGLFETSNKDIFTWGVGDRSASCRIPTFTASNGGKGYIEDRRPASDIDPYVACAVVADSAFVDGPSQIEELFVVYNQWAEWKKDNSDIPKH